MTKIALITDINNPNLPPDDLVLIDLFCRSGIKAIPAVWNNREIIWSDYDAIILRSCWDYFHNFDKFLTWIKSLERNNQKLINPAGTVLWNSHKKYLLDLRNNGLTIVPSILVKRNSNDYWVSKIYFNKWPTIIVKPAVGTGSHNVRLFDSGNQSDIRGYCAKLLRDNDIIIQPYLPEITTEGEISMIFIDGTFSHSVLKIPGKNNFRANPAFGASIKPYIADHDSICLGQKAIELIRPTPLYARIDIIKSEQKYYLTELELIEPNLFFQYYPPAADKFVRTVIKHIN